MNRFIAHADGEHGRHLPDFHGNPFPFDPTNNRCPILFKLLLSETDHLKKRIVFLRLVKDVARLLSLPIRRGGGSTYDDREVDIAVRFLSPADKRAEEVGTLNIVSSCRFP
jgi:hypothetical protein